MREVELKGVAGDPEATRRWLEPTAPYRQLKATESLAAGQSGKLPSGAW